MWVVYQETVAVVEAKPVRLAVSDDGRLPWGPSWPAKRRRTSCDEDAARQRRRPQAGARRPRGRVPPSTASSWRLPFSWRRCPSCSYLVRDASTNKGQAITGKSAGLRSSFLRDGMGWDVMMSHHMCFSPSTDRCSPFPGLSNIRIYGNGGREPQEHPWGTSS
jgi:hypothetical protein